MECTEYEHIDKTLNIEDIYTQDTEKQFEIAENVKIRIQKRKKENIGWPGLPYTWLLSSDLC